MAVIDRTPSAKSIVLRALFAIPVVGWAAACLFDTRNEAKAYGLAVLLMLWALTIVAFGWPAFIYGMLSAVFLNFVIVLLLTRE